MKNYLRVICCLLLAVLMAYACTGCSGEGNGVPEEVVFRHIEEIYNEMVENAECGRLEAGTEPVKFDISYLHDVNKDTHVDVVTVTVIEKGRLGTLTNRITQQYQYDRSSDLWTLIAESEWEGSMELNEGVLTEGLWDYIPDDEAYYDDRIMLEFIEFTPDSALISYINNTLENEMLVTNEKINEQWIELSITKWWEDYYVGLFLDGPYFIIHTYGVYDAVREVFYK